MQWVVFTELFGSLVLCSNDIFDAFLKLKELMAGSFVMLLEANNIGDCLVNLGLHICLLHLDSGVV